MYSVLYSLHSPPLRGMMTASLVSKSCLKVVHQVLRIGQVACRFQSRIIARIAFPQDQVLKLSPVSPLVQNFLNFILRFRVRSNNRRGWNLLSIGKGLKVWGVASQKGDVKDRVNVHRERECKSIGSVRDNFRDMEGSNELGLKFLKGSLNICLRG